jgi:hypothetical protein
MKADILVVGTIPEAFPITNKKLRVEAPSNDGCGDNIIVAIYICSLGYVKELSPSCVVSGSVWLVGKLHELNIDGLYILVQYRFLRLGQGQESRVNKAYDELTLQIFNIGEGLLT